MQCQSTGPEYISRRMSSDQVVRLLVRHGCRDITAEVDFKRCSYEPLARGGFGSIHRGTLRNGQLVAIKYIGVTGFYWDTWQAEGSHWKDAAREIYIWSKCEHSGVLKALGFALFNGFIFLVSPWMQHGSLAGYLLLNDNCDRLQYCVDLVGAVEYLHEKQIVHGDIKAENILVSDSEDIHLVDFGSATLVNYLTLCFTGTSSNQCSLRFAAPEFLLDEEYGRHTVKSDVYALGMTILQILTGRPPYSEELSDIRVVAKIVRKILPSRPKLDHAISSQLAQDKLWNLLLECWEHDPEARPTAAEVKEVLVQIKQNQHQDGYEKTRSH